MVRHLRSKKEFEDLIKRDSVYTVIDFTATWCGPCKKIAPIYEELAKRNPSQVDLVKVDVDEQQELAEQCGVTAMPTFQVWIAKTPVYVTEGGNEANLRALLDKVHERASTGEAALAKSQQK